MPKLCNWHPTSFIEELMKIRLLFAMVGLAIGFVLPTHAQQTNTPDPKLRERVISRFKAFIDALTKKDAAAVGANFTKDAIVVTPYGPVSGRQDIAYWYGASRNFRSRSGQLPGTGCSRAPLPSRTRAFEHQLLCACPSGREGVRLGLYGKRAYSVLLQRSNSSIHHQSLTARRRPMNLASRGS
jgi:hypothetical protein